MSPDPGRAVAESHGKARLGAILRLLAKGGASASGGAAAGSATVEAAITQRDSAGVTPGGQPCCRTAGGEESRDGIAVDVQYLGIQRGAQTAQREAAGGLA